MCVKPMDFAINIEDVQEANLFLRALWSAIRNGQEMGWQVFGYKKPKTHEIDLGFFTCGTLAECKSVMIKYTDKHCLDRITFANQNSKDISVADKKIINDAITKAKKKSFIEYDCYYFTELAIAKYSAENIRIAPSKNGSNIIIKVKAFDEIDCKTISAQIKYKVADILSFLCSRPVSLEECKNISTEWEKMQSVFHDEEWVDQYPYILDKGYKLLLSHSGLNFLDTMIANFDKPDKKMESLLGAARLYNTACKHENFGHDLQNANDFSSNDISQVLFMSVYEVIAQLDSPSAKHCEQCGQRIYSIRRSVLDYLCDNDGLKSIIDEYYKSRSDFVHSAIHLGNRSYQGTSIPQFKKRGTIIKQVDFANLAFLREYGGQKLRSAIKKKFMRLNNVIDKQY